MSTGRFDNVTSGFVPTGDFVNTVPTTLSVASTGGATTTYVQPTSWSDNFTTYNIPAVYPNGYYVNWWPTYPAYVYDPALTDRIVKAEKEAAEMRGKVDVLEKMLAALLSGVKNEKPKRKRAA